MVEVEFDGGILREIYEADVDVLTSLSRNDPKIQKYFFASSCDGSRNYWERVFRDQRVYREFGSSLPRSDFRFCIDEGSGVSGFLSLVSSHVASRYVQQDNSLGFFVGAKFRGRGIATSAVRAIRDYAFDVLGYESISALCLEKNLSSRRVLEKAFFSKGVLGVYSPNGSFDRKVVEFLDVNPRTINHSRRVVPG